LEDTSVDWLTAVVLAARMSDGILVMPDGTSGINLEPRLRRRRSAQLESAALIEKIVEAARPSRFASCAAAVLGY